MCTQMEFSFRNFSHGKWLLLVKYGKVTAEYNSGVKCENFMCNEMVNCITLFEADTV